MSRKLTNPIVLVKRKVATRRRARAKGNSDTPDVSNNLTGSAILRYNGPYMPPKFINKMVVSSTWTCSTAGGFGYYTYRMNDIYDPYVGVGGDGCHGIDEMQAIYGRYIVRSSQIIITATNQGDDVTTLIVHPSANADVPVFNAAESAPEAKTAQLTKYKTSQMSIRARIGKWLQGANDRDAGAASNADPSLQAYWKILLQNGTANALNVVMKVIVIYDTEWSTLNAANDVDA